VALQLEIIKDGCCDDISKELIEKRLKELESEKK
jgi:hypothetical protein